MSIRFEKVNNIIQNWIINEKLTIILKINDANEKIFIKGKFIHTLSIKGNNDDDLESTDFVPRLYITTKEYDNGIIISNNMSSLYNVLKSKLKYRHCDRYKDHLFYHY